jgi:FkbM family methyltransferase
MPFAAVAGLVRLAMGSRSDHVRVSRDGINFDLDLRDHVEMRIFLHAFDREEVATLSSYLRPGDRAIDVGSNVGYYTLHFARAVGAAGEVIAFEPDPRNVERLRANLALNGFTDRADVVAAVATEATGSMKLFLTTGQGGGNSVYSDLWDTGASIDCPATTIDDYCSSRNIDYVRAMKIDVEGHDPAVLRGASRMLRERRIGVVLIEYCRPWLQRTEKEPERFDDPLVSNGYVRVDPVELPDVDNVLNLLYLSPEVVREKALR